MKVVGSNRRVNACQSRYFRCRTAYIKERAPDTPACGRRPDMCPNDTPTGLNTPFVAFFCPHERLKPEDDALLVSNGAPYLPTAFNVVRAHKCHVVRARSFAGSCQFFKKRAHLFDIADNGVSYFHLNSFPRLTKLAVLPVRQDVVKLL